MQFQEALRQRFAGFGLELHPEKTRLIAFGMVYGIKFDYDETRRKQVCGTAIRRHGRMDLWHVFYVLISQGHMFT